MTRPTSGGSYARDSATGALIRVAEMSTPPVEAPHRPDTIVSDAPEASDLAEVAAPKAKRK